MKSGFSSINQKLADNDDCWKVYLNEFRDFRNEMNYKWEQNEKRWKQANLYFISIFDQLGSHNQKLSLLTHKKTLDKKNL